eukprot:scaffold7008_cov47-Prasinocladus_malaysianus.AAC.1
MSRRALGGPKLTVACRPVPSLAVGEYFCGRGRHHGATGVRRVQLQAPLPSEMLMNRNFQHAEVKWKF